MIQVQAMLYASLAVSLLSAFLAMLGKQWLNRYTSTDMRGTGIERSQNRQRKLNGIVTWYFNNVMESLPLMLQVALLLLGCALSLYLWGIDVTVACVVVGVTALGVTFYVFFVVAGAACVSCPYWTPGARIIRPLFSAFHGAVVRARIALACGASRRICIAPSARARGLDQRAATLDLECISWILQTSLENGIRLPTLKFLASMSTPAGVTPSLVSDCFDILASYLKVTIWDTVVVQGMEQLAEVSAMCFFLTYCHLSIIDPMSSYLVGVRRHYARTFPPHMNPYGLPFPRTLGIIHQAIHSRWGSGTPVEWRDYKPTNYEHLAVAHALSKLSWSEHQRREPGQVPPPCLSFALHYLSQDPLPPPSITADCLLIIAIELGCNVPNTIFLEERYALPSGYPPPC
jgi:hypothetical protein